MREVWQATEATPYPFGPFVRMLLVTGQRLREVANATWAEFDLEKALWTIPAERMKGDAAHEVPLSPLALEILRSAPEDDKKPRSPGAYVFSTMGGRAPISGFSKAKIALDRLLAERPLSEGFTRATIGRPSGRLGGRFVWRRNIPALHRVCCSGAFFAPQPKRANILAPRRATPHSRGAFLWGRGRRVPLTGRAFRVA
jgi:hypothetical protein